MLYLSMSRGTGEIPIYGQELRKLRMKSNEQLCSVKSEKIDRNYVAESKPNILCLCQYQAGTQHLFNRPIHFSKQSRRLRGPWGYSQLVRLRESAK